MTTAGATATLEISDWGLLPAEPLVSVYMLAYRHEGFIAQAIEGVISQQCDFPFELIVGEDHSPDRTGEIVLDYQRRYPHLIRVLTAEINVGASANARRCQEATRGRYIAICEGDDYWTDPTKLALQIREFRRCPEYGLVCHAAVAWDSNKDRRSGILRCAFRSRELSLIEIVAGDGGLIPTASIMVRREVLLDRPKWTESLSFGDYSLVIKAALAGKVFYIDRPMSVYRLNVPHSWTQQNILNFGNRIRHASSLDGMFSSLQETTGLPMIRVARPVISKHYSDALVRTNAEQSELLQVYLSVRGRLSLDDHLFSWLSVRCGFRLLLLKTIVRKTKTLLRLISNDIASRMKGL